MECGLLQKCVFELYTHNDKPIWNIENDIKVNDSYSELETILNSHKKCIDNIEKNIWNYNKKLVNDFETLHIPSKNMIDNNGIADYAPISRAFFKMWEILNDYNLLDNNNNLIYGALCEGPGGFIEAFNLYRKNAGHKDTIIAMTLRNEKDDCVPSWKKSDNILKQCSRIFITYGADNTGNLYNVKNIDYYGSMFSSCKADLITADGGFDFSEDYNNQEITIVRLLWCEIVAGLISLKKRGNMIIKIFDCHKQVTVDILYILAYYFGTVYVSKPFTSRPLNSEKYLICHNFKDNIDETDINSIKKIVENMSNTNYDRIIKNNILLDFKECINSINVAYGFRQVRYMHKIFNIINKNVMYKEITLLHKERLVYSYSWCIKYNFPIKKKYNLIRCK
jgi:23S rRNA U2552 (ribose-2'-O)-methylase RlmE/FtsJ